MKNFIYLNYIKDLKARIDADRGLMQVLIGPRQVGKTTSILKMIEDYYKDSALYISVDKVFNSDAQWLVQNWQEAAANNLILFVDEIQKCENWSEAIKKLYDERKKRNKPYAVFFWVRAL